MDQPKHERFLSANQELREFRKQVERAAGGTQSISLRHLQAVSRRLLNGSPEIGDAARSETLDAHLRNEITEYVKNLRALQAAIEKVRLAGFIA